MSLALALAALCGALLLIAAPPGPGRIERSPAPSARRRDRDTGPLAVARLVERVATVVGSGTPPRRAWSAIADAADPGPLRDLARAVGAGSPPSRAASGPLARSSQVSALDAALAACERTGAPLGPVLLTLSEGLRDVADAALARRSAFAAPLATARILLALPLAGIALGMLLGADPLAFLLRGSGRWVLGAGTACTLLGWWWMRRLLRSAAGRADRGVDSSLVLDLVAGPLAAGAPLAQALGAVADGLGTDPLAVPLERAGRALLAGVPVSTALAALPAPLAVLRDVALIGERTGADLVGLLRSAARDARRGRAREAEAAAARLAVRLVLPTGAALLPAFVLLGIVPTVASLLGGSFGAVRP